MNYFQDINIMISVNIVCTATTIASEWATANFDFRNQIWRVRVGHKIQQLASEDCDSDLHNLNSASNVRVSRGLAIIRLEEVFALQVQVENIGARLFESSDSDLIIVTSSCSSSLRLGLKDKSSVFTGFIKINISNHPNISF